MDWTQIVITTLATAGTIVAGFFALIRYFLKHLERKNGHIEKIVFDFNKTITNHLHDAAVESSKQNETFKHLTQAIERLIDKLK